MSKWIEHLNKHYQEKKRTNPKYTFTQAMKDAAKTYKKSKKGGDASMEPVSEATTEPSMDDTAVQGTDAPVVGGAKKNKSRKSKKGGASTAPAQLADTAAPFMGGAKKNKSRKSKKGGNAIIEGNVSERLQGHPSSALITK
jgi:hypothetical protein